LSGSSHRLSKTISPRARIGFTPGTLKLAASNRFSAGADRLLNIGVDPARRVKLALSRFPIAPIVGPTWCN
jgi:hypothetical protein